MVQDPNFLNPLLNPIFYPVLWRFIGVFICGLVLIFILNKFRFNGLFSTNVGRRYISWMWIGVIYLAAIFFGGYPALFFLLVVMALAIWEVSCLTKMPRIYAIVLYVLAVVSIYITSFHPDYFFSLPLLYFIVLGIVSIRVNDKNGLGDYMLTFFVSIWIIFALSHFILLGHLNNELDNTKMFLILLGFSIALSDIGAYVVGKSFSFTPLDKFKIADKISKNKSYAGVLGNILGAGIGIWIMYFALSNYLGIYEMILLAVVIGVFGLVGDLTESLFKRYYKAKDSGKWLSGHGGILDRIDSAMRVIIAVYYTLLFLI